MLPYCRVLAEERQKEIERVMAMPAEKRNGAEQFMALLGEGMQKDSRSYGEYAARQAQKLGWTKEAGETALDMYAPDSALANVSRTFPCPDAVFNKLAYNKEKQKRAHKAR